MLKRIQKWMNGCVSLRLSHSYGLYSKRSLFWELCRSSPEHERRTRESVVRISWRFSVSGVRTLSAMCLHNLKGRVKVARPEPRAQLPQQPIWRPQLLPNNPLIIIIIIALLTIHRRHAVQRVYFVILLLYCTHALIVVMM